MKKKCGILFDCDGTLLDSLGDAHSAFDYAFKKLGEPTPTLEVVKRYFGMSADRIFIKLLDDDREKGIQAFHYYLDYQTQISTKTKMHKGIEQLLTQCFAHKVPMGVVTGRHSKDLEIVLAPHKINHYFKIMIADDQLTKSKPHPEGLLLASSYMELNPENVFYVGDSVTDLQAAHAAGMTAVAACWDKLVIYDEMLKEKPHYLTSTPEEIWNFYQEFSR